MEESPLAFPVRLNFQSLRMGVFMSLNHGRPMVSIPGPSVIPDRVLAAMHQTMPNIYEGSLIDISNSLLEDLPKIARTSNSVFISVSNGHGAWEMAISNTLSRGDRVLILESGRFAINWGEMAVFAFLGLLIFLMAKPPTDLTSLPSFSSSSFDVPSTTHRPFIFLVEPLKGSNAKFKTY